MPSGPIHEIARSNAAHCDHPSTSVAPPVIAYLGRAHRGRSRFPPMLGPLQGPRQGKRSESRHASGASAASTWRVAAAAERRSPRRFRGRVAARGEPRRHRNPTFVRDPRELGELEERAHHRLPAERETCSDPARRAVMSPCENARAEARAAGGSSCRSIPRRRREARARPARGPCRSTRRPRTRPGGHRCPR